MDDVATLCRYAVRALVLNLLLLQTANAATEPAQLPAPDPVSLQCLGCHDGVAAVDVMPHTGTAGGMSYGSGHSIGMRYASVVERRPGAFRDPLADGSRIRLVSGRVSCVSCHAGSSDTAATPIAFQDYQIAQQCMVAGRAGGNLAFASRCLACHLE